MSRKRIVRQSSRKALSRVTGPILGGDFSITKPLNDIHPGDLLEGEYRAWDSEQKLVDKAFFMVLEVKDRVDCMKNSINGVVSETYGLVKADVLLLLTQQIIPATIYFDKR